MNFFNGEGAFVSLICKLIFYDVFFIFQNVFLLAYIYFMKHRLIKQYILTNFRSIYIAALILSPFFALGFFNYPSSDDFSFHQQVSENGIWESLLQLYRTWTGRMTSFLILFLLDPLTDRSFLLYQCLGIIIIVLFFITALKLTQSKYVFNSNNWWSSLSLTAFIIYFLPDMADFFYWFITAYSYTLGLIFLFIWMILHSNFKSLWWNKLFLLILPVFINGACELTILLFAILSFFVLIESGQKKEINYWILGSIIIGWLSAYFWISAPGNNARSQVYESIYNIQTHSFSFAISAAFQKTGSVYFDWLVKKPVIPFIALLAVMIFRDSSLQIEKRKAMIKMLIGISIMPLLLLIYFWSTGINFVPLRLINFGFVAFCLFTIPTVATLIQPILKRNINLQKPLVYASLIGLIVLLGLRSNLRWAVQDLIHANAYQTEIKARIQLLEENKNQSVALPSIKHPLRTTFFADIDSLPTHWYNKGLAWYYGVNEVKKLD